MHSRNHVSFVKLKFRLKTHKKAHVQGEEIDGTLGNRCRSTFKEFWAIKNKQIDEQ